MKKAGINPDDYVQQGLRAKCATANANAKEGGEIVATLVGNWKFDARKFYMWASSTMVDAACKSIGMK